MSALTVAAPVDMAALRMALAGSTGPVHFVAGGTDMLVAGHRLPEAGLLVDVSRVAEMTFIATEGTDIRIGAATTVAALAAHLGLNARLPALCQAAAQCGSVQIRNRATIGGNIANSAPAADLMPVLIAAEARLGLVGRDGLRREAALGDYGSEPGHLIVDVILPGRSLMPCGAFVKLGARRDLTISRLSLALLAVLKTGRFGPVRIVAGSLGPGPRRLPLAEAALTGRKLEPATLRDLLSALAVEVDAAIPGRSSQPYKRRAVAGLGLDLIAQAVGLSPRDRLFAETIE